jgi:hypothetical protein
LVSAFRSVAPATRRRAVAPLRSKAQNGRFGKLSENLMKVRVEAKPEDAKSFCGGA